MQKRTTMGNIFLSVVVFIIFFTSYKLIATAIKDDDTAFYLTSMLAFAIMILLIGLKSVISC